MSGRLPGFKGLAFQGMGAARTGMSLNGVWRIAGTAKFIRLAARAGHGRRHAARVRAALVVGLCLGPMAVPERSLAQTPPATDPWQFEVTPYFWAAGMSGWGRIGARTPTVRFNPSFSDIWRDLDVGAMGTFEARKGRWGVLFDAMYVKLSQTSNSLRGGYLGKAKVDISQTILQLAGAYRVVDDRTVPVDVLAGLRYTYLDGELSFSQGLIQPDGPERSNNVSWVDGFAGVRARYYLTDKWSLVGYADAGTGGTKYSWQLIAGTNYDFTKSVVGKFGYRIISMKYETSQFLYDVKTSGLYLGVGIKF
jgi:opacity protein-like surface antigen